MGFLGQLPDMASNNNGPSEGDEISHDEFFLMAGGTIPFNLTTKDVKTGDPKIRCPRCDNDAPEEQFDWVDSNVYIESVADDGTVLNHDIQAVFLECPHCEKQFSAY